MSAWGGLGGLGGMPNSKVVQNVDTWGNDWQKRRDALAATARPAGWTDRLLQVSGPSNAGAYVGAMQAGANTRWNGGGATPRPEDAYTPKLGWGTLASEDGTDKAIQNSQFAWGRMWSPGSAPDFTELNREKALIDQTREAGIRNQQAYQSMTGWGQQNGVIGPDYSNPNFGTVSGQGAPQINVPAGIDMGWASGMYDPNFNGVFGSNGQPRNRWGF